MVELAPTGGGIILAGALTAATTAFVMSRMTDTTLVERDVAAAHIRSLLEHSPTQITTS